MLYKYKVVIADDEQLIRNGLTSFIKQHFPFFQLEGAYESGEEVMEHLKEKSADILILDVKMQNVTGLDIAKYIFENKIETQVIIITGYRDFDYARQALDYHTYAILLKPVDLNKLMELLNNLKDKMDKRAEQIQNESRDYLKLRELNRQYLERIILGGMPVQKMEAALGEVPFKNKKCAVLKLTVYKKKKIENADSIWRDMGEIKTDDIDAYFLSCQNDTITYVILFEGNDDESNKQAVDTFISELLQNTGLSYGIRFFHELEFYKSLYDIQGLSDETKGISPSDMIDRVIQYVHTNYSSDITLESVAKNFYFNSSYLSRFFKGKTDVNFVDYLTEVRINKAKELLKTRRYTVNQVGDMVGYPNTRYFVRVFKNKTGMTPHQYCIK